MENTDSNYIELALRYTLNVRPLDNLLNQIWLFQRFHVNKTSEKQTFKGFHNVERTLCYWRVSYLERIKLTKYYSEN